MVYSMNDKWKIIRHPRELRKPLQSRMQKWAPTAGNIRSPGKRKNCAQQKLIGVKVVTGNKFQQWSPEAGSCHWKLNPQLKDTNCHHPNNSINISKK